MGPGKDAYGQQILAYFNGEKVPEIVERDDGYISASFSSNGLYFAGFRDWPEIEREAIRFATGKVLDIGCGAGRVELYLQRKKYDVTGIDTSPLAIKVCRMRGVKKARVMSIRGVSAFRAKEFDTIVMFGHNFGLFGDYRTAKRLLRQLYRITSGDAVILATGRDPYKEDNPIHAGYDRSNLKKGRMYGQLRMRVRFGKLAGEWLDYLYVSKSEMKNILEGTGWKIERFIPDYPHYAVVMAKDRA